MPKITRSGPPPAWRDVPDTADTEPGALTSDEGGPGERGPYEDWTRTELADAAAARGLATSGTKTTLIDRLREQDAEHSDLGE